MAENTQVLADLRQLFRDIAAKLGKRGVIAVLALLVLGSSTFAGWKTGALEKIYWSWNRAEAWVLVQNQEDARPLVGIEIAADGQTSTTNENGMANFKSLRAGEVAFSISIPGFEDFTWTENLRRGLNLGLLFSLEIASGDVRGAVLDYVDGSPIDGAQVTALGTSTVTDSRGLFALNGVVVGEQSVKIAGDGYYDLTIQAEVVKGGEVNLGPIRLLGRGKAVFASSRDKGIEAVYWARFDGSELVKIWENVAGLRDHTPMLSPDGRKIVFLSERDNLKDQDGVRISLPYYFDIATKTLKKISTNQNFGSGGWLADSSGFVYQTYGESEELTVFRPSGSSSLALAKAASFGTNASIGGFAASPKSDWVAFFVYIYYPDDGLAEGRGVYLVRPDGTGLKKISSTEASWGYLKFSEGGAKLLFQDDVSGKYYSYTLATETTAEIPAPSDACVSYYNFYDCPEVRFSAARNLRASTSYRDGKTDLYISKEDGSGERRITTTGGVEDFYFAGPGDRYLVYWYWVFGREESTLNVVGLAPDLQPIKITDISSFAGIVSEE